MPEQRFSRQVLAFGQAGQAAIASTHAAIVGLGGTGSQVVQSLAYLGVGRFTLVDADHVEESNLNRLVGAVPADIGRSKVAVAAAQIARVNGNARLSAIAQDLRSRRALSELKDATVVFGCVDNDGARLILTELCCAYRKLYIDLASEIIPPAADSPFDFGGRVVVCPPGEFCLMCAGELDGEAAKKELEDPAVRDLRAQHGYGVADTAAAPSVVSLNGIIAGVATTEYMVAVTGLRAPLKKSTYRGMRGVVKTSIDDRRAGCFNCEYLLGRADRTDIMRYALD